MGCKYVKDFDFGPQKTYVKGYMRGGAVKGKVSKVMGEFGKGELHSGSKEGPVVKNPKQAVAIALSEARKAPMKKAKGGKVEIEQKSREKLSVGPRGRSSERAIEARKSVPVASGRPLFASRVPVPGMAKGGKACKCK